MLISIHSLRVEGDISHFVLYGGGSDFNPLPPCGGRPYVVYPTGHKDNFNPLPPCGGRHRSAVGAVCTGGISIHSLRVEGDGNPPVRTCCHPISIHSLRVEGDSCARTHYLHTYDFNPLPPCGGRQIPPDRFGRRQDFNPLPPCGGRQFLGLHLLLQWYFNPLPPCGGRPLPLIVL